ncbi:MAG: EF-hand domain-containing protein [Pseudomonadota bacterium]|nr:EF-hand domain-containing protein [Pseudomonadota bacterium]
MLTRIIAASAFVFAASAANAQQQVDFASVDTDQSGGLSFSEVQAISASATQDEFTKYDTDGSGELSESEFDAWLNPTPQ